ncbi:MAG TPA: succinyl-diaminopimelate desuccinylase [Steroidobacteraceae bacterium]
MTPLDPLALAQALIRCKSVTPHDGGAQALLAQALEPFGFTWHAVPFTDAGTPDVTNLFARVGHGPPHLAFAGHTDVVPVGDRAGWHSDPFGGEVTNGTLYGRGAADMKGAIACFVAAAARFLAARNGDPGGSISLLITGDEEGAAVNGTARLVEWLRHEGETIDACVVGEPTNPNRLGEMIKIGRRGSLSGWLTVTGTQGHTAYPHLADNPLPRLVRMLGAIAEAKLDDGTPHFQPSNLELTSIDVGNTATNVIPAKAIASFNIRFNDRHTGKSLTEWLRRTFDAVSGDYDLRIVVSGEAFLTEQGPFSALLASAVERSTGIRPEFSTTGGTSDARFIRALCPVAEFGLLSQTMHKTDECVALADLAALTQVYESVLDAFFAR